MMYVKFADQFLGKSQYEKSLFYIEQALAMNPSCLVSNYTAVYYVLGMMPIYIL